jgi:hypothetical protein
MPLPQAMPQPPQLLLSQLGSTQVLPPQQICQVAQMFPPQLQTPPEQVEGAVHVTPQAPQLLLSTLVSVHEPWQQSADLPVQKTAPQVTTWQGLTIPTPASSGMTDWVPSDWMQICWQLWSMQ